MEGTTESGPCPRPHQRHHDNVDSSVVANRGDVLSWLVRLVVVVAPFSSSLATAWILTRVTPVPTAASVAILRWIAFASSVVLVVTDRLARRLVPIATLLQLTLTFPDDAPSRFQLALRTRSSRRARR